jgi:hypothetical protein
MTSRRPIGSDAITDEHGLMPAQLAIEVAKRLDFLVSERDVQRLPNSVPSAGVSSSLRRGDRDARGRPLLA